MSNLGPTQPWEAQCLTILQELDTSSQISDAGKMLYRQLFAEIGEKKSRGLVSWAACHWRNEFRRRPDSRDLRDVLDALMNRHELTADAAYAEMLEKRAKYGEYAERICPEHAVYRIGEPPWSHPVIGECVKACGGWSAICSGEAQMAEGLSKQFRRAFEQAWQKRTVRQQMHRINSANRQEIGR